MARLRPFLFAFLAGFPLAFVALAPFHGPSGEDASASHADARPQTPMQQMWDRYGDSFQVDPIPEGLSPGQRADYILDERVVLGRTPMGWVDWVHEAYSLDLPEQAPPALGRLDAAVLQVYQVAGVTPAAQDLSAALQATSQVPVPLQAPLADLLATVSQAYAQQRPLADELVGRLAEGLRPDVPLLRPDERDAMAQRGELIVDAVNQFNARFDTLAALGLRLAEPQCLVPIVDAGECLVYLGSDGDDTYDPNPGLFPDPILIVEPNGKDTYRNSAGGANPTGLFAPGVAGMGNLLAVSVVADLAGNDVYDFTGEALAVQGAGSLGGLGILLDADGNDLYRVSLTRTTFGPNPLLGYLEGGAQGHGYAGVGLLLDGLGDDVYDFRMGSTAGRCMWAEGQGFGGAGGLGVASDGWGTDKWITTGLGLSGGDNCFGSDSTDANDAYIGLYTQGVGFYGGVGIMTDTGFGDDDYPNYNNASATDYYAQGFGAFAGLGILYDDGGDDEYVAWSKATDTTPFFDPLLLCAYGTGSAGGVGIMVDVAGDDLYYAKATSNLGAANMVQGAGDVGAAYGLFIDGDGTDRHTAYVATTGSPTTVVQVFGRGVLDTDFLTYNVAGTYLDLGGFDDTYIPLISSDAGVADDGMQWLFGLDDGP